MGVLAALFSSRKFVIAILAMVLLAPLVYLGSITVDRYVQVVQTLTIALIAAIGVEGAAEKVLTPPHPDGHKADSLRPPKPPPAVASTMAIVLIGTVALIACVKGASVREDPNGGVDACVELARRCQCISDGGTLLFDVGFGR